MAVTIEIIPPSRNIIISSRGPAKETNNAFQPSNALSAAATKVLAILASITPRASHLKRNPTSKETKVKNPGKAMGCLLASHNR